MISPTTVSLKQPYGITVIIIKWRSASVWWFGGLKVSAFIGTYACRSNSLFSNMLFGEREREREVEREKERKREERKNKMISTTTVSGKQPYGITAIIIKWRSASVWRFGGLKVSLGFQDSCPKVCRTHCN